MKNNNSVESNTVKTQLIYIKPNDSSFIRIDQQIFEKHYDLHPILLKQLKSKFHYGIKISQMFLVLISKIFIKNVFFVSWFADYHSAVMVFTGKLMRKKTIIFIGGQEAISYPELNKGVFRKKIRGAFVKYALRNADLIIANHKSLIYHENFYYNQAQPHIDGISHYVKDLSTQVEIIYNGIDPLKFVRDYTIPKQKNLVLTVGTMNQKGDFYNKGFDLFIQTAEKNPQLAFVLIGLHPDYLEWTENNYRISKIPNLKIIPYLCPYQVLNEYYNKARVFVQASITEGMPNTLSEAMLLECVPVGSNVNGIPDAIGDTGVIIMNRTVEDLENGIQQALGMSTAQLARERVMQLFSFEKREEKIIQVIRKFLPFT
jgi:glycosyltransferase involved in cell wall biosynthesis